MKKTSKVVTHMYMRTYIYMYMYAMMNAHMLEKNQVLELLRGEGYSCDTWQSRETGEDLFRLPGTPPGIPGAAPAW